MIARDAKGQLVAHYGATVRHIRLCGQPTRALQSCDVMVRACERGLLGRRGVFFQVARAFQERYLGERGSGEFCLAYGFPHARAMRLPVLLGLYREVDKVTEMHWHPLSSSGLLSPKAEQIYEPREILAVAKYLWCQMAPQLEEFIVVERDPGYLCYRYLSHPEFDYQYLIIRQPWTRRPMGLMVLKAEAGKVKIMEVLADVRDLRSVLLSVRRAMVTRGWDTLIAWVANSQMPHFVGMEGADQEIDVRIPDHAWTSGLPIESIRNRWWISLGDTDFA